MVIVSSEKYDRNIIPPDCIHAHFDGINYYFAQNQSDVDTIMEMISLQSFNSPQ